MWLTEERFDQGLSFFARGIGLLSVLLAVVWLANLFGGWVQPVQP